MNPYIENLIRVNKEAVKNISDLEKTINNTEIKTEKDKANFGNLCIILKGFRMVSEGTECLLNNENILKVNDTDFYAKINDEDVLSNEKQS